jgi:hypothetical protein
MDHSKVIASLLIAGLALGCASLRWSVQKALREEGSENRGFPEVVWEEYDCGTQKRPFLIVEENELVPPTVKAGGEFNHRMVYVMCPANPTEVVPGQLSTRIRFKGDPIMNSTDLRYEIKPGRWVVDAFVEIPENAEPGVYAYEVGFSGKGLKFDKSLTFLVKRN